MNRSIQGKIIYIFREVPTLIFKNGFQFGCPPPFIYEIRRKVEELRREFYINCCVVLDKSHPKNKKKICEDKLIEAIYYERDKNCAHRDDDYKSPEFNQLSDMIETMKHQIQKVLVVCRDSLPSNITLDFVSHDKELFRLIYGITAEKEEEIKHKKYPEYGKTPQS